MSRAVIEPSPACQRSRGGTVAVVIPFYQREAGILSRALDSVLAQDFAGDVEIVVVDDASPLAAEDEVAGHPARERFVLRILRQSNRGPGAARNAALDSLGPRVSHVAFLDSDDAWAPHHVSSGVRALERGYDVYFSNHLEWDESLDALQSLTARGFDMHRHECLDAPGQLYGYRGDMSDQVIRLNVVETSTVIYRFAALRNLRFREGFRHAFEDHLFWMDLDAAGSRWVFSAAIGVHYGHGVNIYRGALWNSDGALRRTAETVRYLGEVSRQRALSAAQRRHIDESLAKLRLEFAAVLAYRLRRRAPLQWRWIAQQVRLDPLTALQLPLNFARLMLVRARRV